MITSFIIGFVIGMVSGLLVMRKHKAKADSIEAKGKELLDALKGK